MSKLVANNRSAACLVVSCGFRCVLGKPASAPDPAAIERWMAMSRSAPTANVSKLRPHAMEAATSNSICSTTWSTARTNLLCCMTSCIIIASPRLISAAMSSMLFAMPFPNLLRSTLWRRRRSARTCGVHEMDFKNGVPSRSAWPCALEPCACKGASNLRSTSAWLHHEKSRLSAALPKPMLTLKLLAGTTAAPSTRSAPAAFPRASSTCRLSTTLSSTQPFLMQSILVPAVLSLSRLSFSSSCPCSKKACSIATAALGRLLSFFRRSWRSKPMHGALKPFGNAGDNCKIARSVSKGRLPASNAYMETPTAHTSTLWS
mmetsp:Transcript_116793/g.337423  ORF Transcript_116793/g.337423 Transcript_116793/m.337423 type:complete len:318 (-) Transcript_116793:1021-1974(-)